MSKQHLFAVAATLLAGCGGATVPMDDRIQAVNVITLTQSQQLNERYFTGQVMLADLTPMSFRLEGTITKITVRPGQKVSKGDVLAYLDDINVRQQWQDANAQHQLLLRNLKRSKPLLGKGLLAQSEYDELNAKARLARVNLGIAAARLSYTELLAPFDGVVDSLAKEQFETTAAGETVLSVYRNDRTDVEMQLPDTLLLRTAGLHRDVDYHPQVNSDNAPEAISMDYLEHSMQLDPSVGAYTVRLTTTKPNPLIHGEAVQIRLNMGASGLPKVHGFMVPLSAIEATAVGDAFQVWKVQQGVTNPIDIEVERISQQGALISGQLQQGDRLIVTGLSQLRPNQLVKVIAKESKQP